MAVTSVKQPFPPFGDVDGNPLESGYIYIGTINLDPVTNPISVFWDAALTVPAAQPIRTIGGYPSNNGTPGALFASDEYSITIKNKNSTLVSTAPTPTVEISVATSTKIGGVKSGGGISVDPVGVVTIVNDSHTHDTQYYPQAQTYNKTEADALLDAKAPVLTTLTTENADQVKTGGLTIGQDTSILSWSFVGTTITINTSIDHNLKVSDVIYVDGLVATTNPANGTWVVLTVEDTDTITFTATDIPTGTPTVSSAFVKSGILDVKGTILSKNQATAWVNFDGTATPPTIRDSFNVLDVARISTGVYDITFTTPMDNANYSVLGTAGDVTAPRTSKFGVGDTDIPTVTSCIVRLYNAANVAINSARVHTSFMGGKN